MSPRLEIHDTAEDNVILSPSYKCLSSLLPRVLFGELDHVLLYELSHPAGATVTLTELDGQPRQLRDEPPETVPQGRVTVNPSGLEKQASARHTAPIHRSLEQDRRMTARLGEMVTSHSLDIMIVGTPVTSYIHWTTSFNLCTSNRAVKLSWLPSGLVQSVRAEWELQMPRSTYNVLRVRTISLNSKK